jgi:[ribosomal protein S5]-alanine N-acetyltransferase
VSTEIEPGDWQLREWAPTDEAALVKYANNIKIWENVRDVFPYPYTSLDAQEWIDRASQRPITNFAIALPAEAIGGVGFVLQEDIYSRSAEIGYWVGEPFWGKGIATSALGALVRFAFSNFDLVRLYATVFEWNTASARVLEKNGFELEGRLAKSVTKKGATIDSLLYALLRTD